VFGIEKGAAACKSTHANQSIIIAKILIGCQYHHGNKNNETVYVIATTTVSLRKIAKN